MVIDMNTPSTVNEIIPYADFAFQNLAEQPSAIKETEVMQGTGAVRITIKGTADQSQ